MSQALTILPEALDIANAYLQYGDIATTARELEIPKTEVARLLALPQTKAYLDQVFLDIGYRNRNRLNALMDKIIDHKLEEAEESEIFTSKDLVDLITLQHKMNMDYLKAQKPDIQNNIQVANINGGSAYSQLMDRLLAPPQGE